MCDHIRSKLVISELAVTDIWAASTSAIRTISLLDMTSEMKLRERKWTLDQIWRPSRPRWIVITCGSKDLFFGRRVIRIQQIIERQALTRFLTTRILPEASFPSG